MQISYHPHPHQVNVAPSKKVKDTPILLLVYTWIALFTTITFAISVAQTTYSDGVFSLFILLSIVSYAIGLFTLIWGIQGNDDGLLSSSITFLAVGYIGFTSPFILGLIGGESAFPKWIADIIDSFSRVVLIFTTLNSLLFIGAAFYYRGRTAASRILEPFGGKAPLLV